MTKTLIHLIALNCSILLSLSVWGQCRYKVTLHTNKGYCVGSSLIATSTHALQKITWYQNGQPISTATGSQSLSTRITRVPILPVSGIYNGGNVYYQIGADDAGNIYVNYEGSQLLKATPVGAVSKILQVDDNSAPVSINGMDVDPAGNIYVSIYSGFTALVWKVPAGTASTTFGELAIAVPIGVVPKDTLPVSTEFVDCQNNVYLFCPNTAAIYRYSPGAVAATHLGNGAVNNTGCYFDVGIGSMYTDLEGNIFFEDGFGVEKLLPGANAPVTAVPATCSTDNSRVPVNFWVDGDDTVYLSVVDGKDEIGFVEKWAPGASIGERILSVPLIRKDGALLPITMDARGNLLLACEGDSAIYKFERTSTIDSAFTATDTGTYYAVVTDIRGYTTTSDTFHINAPSAGPPSIQITATATSTAVCTPITFTAQTTNAGTSPSFQWQVSGVPAGGDSIRYSYNLFANGDDIDCIMITQAGCAGPVSDTSNIITLSIDPHGAASVTISTPKDSICLGDSAIFKARVTNGSAQPVFQWLVNGDSTDDTGAVFNGSNLQTGDVITCLITSDDACGLAKSNSIPLIVSIPPVIQPGQIFTIPRGGSLTLDPVVSGTVNTWAWSPGSWLSDSTIENPVADPPATVTYTLMVEASGGCGDTATILVDVFTPLAIPNAFTPNGDGRNDRFYVLGGPVNSVVETFDVFNRWGQAVFSAHDAAPGDAGAGWDGRINGSPAPSGTYVYVAVIRFATGTRQMYKGTVEVIR